MKKQVNFLVPFFQLLVICGLLFIFGNLMQTMPKQISGNGNLGVVSMLALVILFPFVVYVCVRLLIQLRIRPRGLSLLGVGAVLDLCFGYLYQLQSYSNYKEFVKEQVISSGRTSDEVYIDSITSGFSSYMNSQFFNVNTFIMFGSSVLVASILIVWISRRIVCTEVNEEGF